MAGGTDRQGVRPVPLAAVLITAAGYAAALTCVYRAMRDVMIENGGYCASGGPYQINPDQVCGEGQTALLIGGILGGLVLAFLLVVASGWYADDVSGVGPLLWAALFGALGFNFLQLGIDPPEDMSGAAGWIVCGVLFWFMALGGLVVAGIGIGGYLVRAGGEKPPSMFEAPLVRAKVPFVRSTPGDPAYGSADPSAPAEETSAPQRVLAAWIWLAVLLVGSGIGVVVGMMLADSVL
jgi:hypothetical protein